MPDGGPYLKAALICESVLEEKSGTLTLVRLVDRITTQAVGPNAPASMPPQTWRGAAVIMLVPGAARGSADVRLELEHPSGLSQQLGTQTVLLEGEDRGINLIINLLLTFENQGLYWLHVYVDDVQHTQVPLRLVYLRQLQAPAPPPLH